MVHKLYTDEDYRTAFVLLDAALPHCRDLRDKDGFYIECHNLATAMYVEALKWSSLTPAAYHRALSAAMLAAGEERSFTEFFVVRMGADSVDSTLKEARRLFQEARLAVIEHVRKRLHPDGGI